jgi:hypothetical protein
MKTYGEENSHLSFLRLRNSGLDNFTLGDYADAILYFGNVKDVKVRPEK